MRVNIFPLVVFAAVAAVMLAELRLSRANERLLRGQGAAEPRGDVYRSMRVVYPACFVAMTVEGYLAGRPALPFVIAGVVIFLASKALKAWAILSLGPSWSFRVLVRPGRALVAHGPYRYLRHPNYLAVVGEIVGMACLVAAPVTGMFSTAAMVMLLRRRIAIEERALGLR